jgi:vitamin B12/bleomycin/antimicrobial peptide transport system ATP-binding/permease protein
MGQKPSPPSDAGTPADTKDLPEEALGRETFRKTCAQFLLVTKGFFASERRRKARGFLTALIILSLAVGGVQVLMSYALRDFMTAIANRDFPEFWRSLGWYLGTFVLAVPIGVYYRWVEERLGIIWREWMSQHLLKRYFNNRAYYQLRGSESIDNPDQRISEDVKNFTTSSLAFFLIALNSIVTLVAFMGVLWTISGFLVGIMVLYAVVGTTISIIIGRKLVRLHYQQYEKEANFRYGLVRVRDNAESIAFYAGEKREHLDLVGRFAEVVKNTGWIIQRNRNLAFFTNSYNYVALVIPLMVVGPMFMNGRFEFGVVPQSQGAFSQVLAAASMIITQFGGLSAYLAGVQRLGNLWTSLDEHDAEEERAERIKAEGLDEGGSVVRLDNLTIQTPKEFKTLVSNLSFELGSHQSLLIMGPSGTGKSSVLRTIAGLWMSGSGSLERPMLVDLMFLPQRPYMVEGNLRSQLLYPYPDRGVTDEQIREVVEKVNLTDVLDRVDGDLDSTVDWPNVLSLGEQQRVAFARLFLRQPKFAFLDEATSALDEENQKHLYELLKQSGIGSISVGHRSTLIEYHDRLLELDRSGSWEMKTNESRSLHEAEVELIQVTQPATESSS